MRIGLNQFVLASFDSFETFETFETFERNTFILNGIYYTKKEVLMLLGIYDA
jgi:hypothetical protein